MRRLRVVYTMEAEAGPSTKKRKYLHVAKKRADELYCEWQGCPSDATPFSAISDFLFHLKRHSSQTVAATVETENVQEINCGWHGCGESNFETSGEFHLHVSYHGFHSKLMAWGLVVLDELSQEYNRRIQCNLDSYSRTLLLELPSKLVCLWEECYTEFIDAEAFYRHVELHATDSLDDEISSLVDKGVKFAKCSWVNCHQSLRSKSHLKEHMRAHTHQKFIACPTCGATFASSSKFIQHVLRQQQPEDSTQESITVNINIDETPIQLTLQVTSDQNLEPSSAETPSDGNKRSSLGTFKCSLCSSSFVIESLLREHERKHVKSSVCDICKTAVASPSALKRHHQYRHSNHRPFECQFCPERFKMKGDLSKHIETHDERNPYKCSQCDFEARSSHTITKHEKEFHENIVQIFLCHECKRQFTRGNNLTRHLVKQHAYPKTDIRCTYVKQDNGMFMMDKATIESGKRAD